MTSIQNAYDLTDEKRDELQDTLVHFINNNLTDDPELGTRIAESFDRRIRERRDLKDDEVQKMNRDEKNEIMAAMREQYGERFDRLREKFDKYVDKIFAGDRQAKQVFIEDANWPYDKRFAEIVFEKARKAEI
jgi:hypothetical protein